MKSLLPLLCLLLLSVAPLRAAEEALQLYYGEAICRKEKDEAWKIRIEGEVVSLAGCYLLMHDSRGKLLVKEHIPHGVYSADNALEMTIPKDGVAPNEYRLLLIGHQFDVMGIRLPLTSLTHEVYGYDYFAKRVPHRIWFMADTQNPEYRFSSRSKQMAVLDQGTPVALKQETGEKGLTALVGHLKPGHVYELNTEGTFYFRSQPGIHLSPEAAHCFLPQLKLREVAWWRIPPTR